MFDYKINYTAGSIITVAATLLFGALIFFRSRGGKIARSYFLLMFAVAMWSLGMYMMLMSTTSSSALFWARFMHIGASFVPVSYFHVILKLINLANKQKKITRAGYAAALIFACLNFTPYFIPSVSQKLGMVYADPGRFYFLFIIFFAACPIYAQYVIFKSYNKLTDLGKKQIGYVSVAGVSGFFSGALVFFTVYGVRVPVLGPFAIYMIALANLLVAIATYTARLMDVELIKRRTLIFSLLYGGVVGIFVVLVFIGQRFLTAQFNINRWVMPAAALLIITVLIRPLENLLASVTDKVLYQRRYDYLVTLKSAAKGMTLVTDTKKLLKIMARLVSKKVRVTGCSVYIFNKGLNSYIKEVQRGFNDMEIADEVHTDSSLIEWLKEKKEPLSYENILAWIQGDRLFPQRMMLKKTLDRIRLAMRKMGAFLCVPSFLRGDMVGFMVLGAKLSGDRYTRDDMSLLSTLSNNAAMALENARMYEELNKRIEKLDRLYREEHGLFMDAASAFSYAIDSKDGYTHTHTLKVSNYAVSITKQLRQLLPYVNFDEDFYDRLKITCLLHDIGKIGVPDKILMKRGRLTKNEQENIKQHAVIGERILHPIREIEDVFELIRHHHENYDGTGYPDGLKGNDIPMISRIIAVANAYDTMTSDRPHRKALGRKEAMKRIEEGAGAQFDPVIVKAFFKIPGISAPASKTKR